MIWFQDITPVVVSNKDKGLNNSLIANANVQFPMGKIWSSRSVRRIYGPPGTGKTTRLVNIASEAIRNGIKPEDIGYFAFTNVAADEAKDRISKEFELEPSRFSNFSTLHSLTTRMGGNLGRELCQKEHLERFDNKIGTREEWLRAGDPSSVVVRPIHPVLSEYSIMFNRKQSQPKFFGKSLEDARLKLGEYYGLRLSEEQVTEYASKYFQEYEDFKKTNNLSDFNDVVSVVAKEAFPIEKVPTFELLIIDEAQDLSALQWDVVNKLSKKAKTTVIAGDDDQAIMESFGAAPDLFNSFPTTEPDEVLPISYRLPRNLKQYVDKTFSTFFNVSTNRKIKEWKENPEAKYEGEVINSIRSDANNNQAKLEQLNLNHLLRIVEQSKDKDWLIMAPTRATCGKISLGLSALNIPHFCHRKDVLGTNNKIHVQTIHTSKGMGADYVALVGLTAGDRYLLDQEPRLKYVALTRSKNFLYLVDR